MDVWPLALDAPDALINDIAETTLSAQECARAARFINAQARRQFVLTKAFLRRALASALRCHSTEVHFDEGEHGKPYLGAPFRETDITFNVSHTAGLALVALTVRHEIGVDVEAIRLNLDWPPLARRFFSIAEYNAINTLPTDEQHRAFFACWARKEAVLKATGKGIFGGLDTFDVSVSPQEPARLLATRWPPQSPTLVLHSLAAGAEHAAALAVAGHVSNVTLHACQTHVPAVCQN